MGNGNTKAGTIRRLVQARKTFREALNLWPEDRMNREHWREVMRDAPSVVYGRKRTLMESKDDELMEEFHKLLEGQTPQETRAVLTTKEIALFLSSTFTDMKTERDLLMEDVYPYLREFCRRLGYEFSVADMRWGVRDQMTDEHQAVQICVTEVQRCRRGSVGPYMACIIGDKYGYRPLPVSVAKEVFEMLLESVRCRGGKDSSELLEKWYRLDENSVPAVYVLQPVSTYYPYAYKNRIAPNSDNVQHEKYLWWKESELMREALTNAASEIDVTAFAFSDVSERDFVVSVTEKEIMAGVQGDDTDPRYMFLFLRSRRGLTDSDGNGNHNDAVTRHCVDVLTYGHEGENTESGQLKRLKETCEKHFLLNNTFRYNVDFHVTNEGHIDARSNQEEMKKFCDKFCQFMVDGIQEAIANHDVIDDPLFNEVLHHTMVAKRRTDTFVGRAHCLRKVEAYLQLEHGSKLFIVYGISGCGKTSILAKAFNSSLENWNGVETGRPVHVIRFLGTSPSSSNVRSLLSSLCYQLCFVLKDTSSIVPNNYDHLVATFRSLLQRATAEKPLVLFLDSLDQLSDQDDGRALGWLPVNLPRNVHIVVSTLPNLGGCLNVLRTKLKQKNNLDNYLEVSSLEANDAESILDTRLEKASRRITATQRAQVLGACPKPTALYMKMACDTALRWKSFTANTDGELKATATQMITLLFERLITTHGEQFVRRALGYITASRTGLTKTELEDILSCDDIVLDDDVFKYHVPLVRRLPTLLWTRLRNDLGSYLVEVTADGHVVYRWYHRQFLEAARICFLSDKPFTDSLHAELANYFNGRWAREAKPYTDRDGNVRSAYRMVANQPLILSIEAIDRFDPKVGETGPRYNLRKLSELPSHLIKAEMWNEFAEVVCKIPWLTAKCKTGKAFELALELSEACLRCNTEKSAIMEDVYSGIRANAQQLNQFPELVLQLCLNEPDTSYCALIAQEYLEKLNSSSEENVTLWRDLTKLQSRKTNVATFQHPTAVRKCFFSKGCKFLATFATDGILRVFMVASGSTVMTTRCDCHVIGFPANEDHCHWIAVLGSNSIVRYGLGSGGKHEGSILQEIKLDCDVDDKAGVVINKKGKAWEIFLATSQGKIRSYSTSPSSNGRPVLKEELPRKPRILAISPDGKLLAFGSDKLYLWNSKDVKDTRVFETGKKATNMEGGTLRFSSNGSKLGAVLANGTYIWSTQTGKPLKKLAMNCLEVEFIVFAPELDYIASPSVKDKEDVLVFCMAPKPYDKSPEWESLKGHSSMVRGCCIGNRANGHPLIATAADDCTVQLWDTRNIPSPKVATWPEHLGSVQDCAFSTDETLAVSCSATETWVWQLQSPVKRLQQLYPASNAERRSGPCFSEDNHFVAVFVQSGVDVWNLKSGVMPHGADSSLLLGAHRTLTFLDVRHLFTTFTSDGLYCSLVTDSEPNCVRLYLAINKYTLGRWATHEPEDSPPTDLNHQEAFEQRFAVEEGRQIATAAISNTCGRLAAISVPRHKRAQEAMTGPTELHLWDLNTHATWKILLHEHPTVEHVLKIGFDFLVTLVQGRKVFPARQGKKIASSRSSGAVVHVINGRGMTLQTFHIPGMFSGLSGVNSEASLQSVSGRMLAYGLQDGVVKAQHIQSGRLLGTFTVNNTQITVVTITSSGKSAIVGCANGNVHIIKLG